MLSVYLLEVIYDWLSNDHPKDYSTIVLDSLNEMQYLAMSSTLENYPKIRRSYGSLPGESDYGKMLFDFDNMIRFYKSLPYHILLIAQSNTQQRDTDIVMPQLTGKNTARNIMRMMDVIGYLHKSDDSKVRVMSFDVSDHVTKDRSGQLPAKLQRPTFRAMSTFWGAPPANRRKRQRTTTDA